MRCQRPSWFRGHVRWTGNRADAEDITTWTFRVVAGNLSLPDLVEVVDDHILDATFEAVTRHWDDRYGIARMSCAETCASEGTPSLESLFDGLTAEMRLLVVLRIMRRHSPAAIAAQLRLDPEAARRRIVSALALVAQRIGFPAASGEPSQVDQVSTYLDDLIGRRRPLRFEAHPESPPMVAAAHVQAAMAGNDLPAQAFVRSLEKTLQAGRGRLVTDVRISSA